MSLRYDDWGKPIGLNWEAITPEKPKVQILKSAKKAKKKQKAKIRAGK